MDIDKYRKSERRQTIHRSINTVSTVLVLLFTIFFVKNQLTPVYEEFTGISEQRAVKEEIYSEIVQVGDDEGYRRCVYKDHLGLDTVGFGHLLRPDESYKCIDPHLAIKLLRKDYTNAQREVEKRYPWAEDEVKMILINLTFNMGSTRLAKFKKTLGHLEAQEYDMAAGELLNSKYARQVPNRAARIATRIMRLQR